jgi:hypothetical protein
MEKQQQRNKHKTITTNPVVLNNKYRIKENYEKCLMAVHTKQARIMARINDEIVSLVCRVSSEFDKHWWNDRVTLFFTGEQLHKGKGKLECCAWTTTGD